MLRPRIERRLRTVSTKISSLRISLESAEEALRQTEDEAEDARLRALVSETPLAQREYEDSRRHVEAQRRGRDRIKVEMAKLELAQDGLLDAYTKKNGSH